MKPPARLIPKPPPGLRERCRADGSVRIWWEPSAAARALGFAPVELDAARLTWSLRQAEKLNRELAAAATNGRRTSPGFNGRSVEALINEYRRSFAFTDLADKTRSSYEANFRLVIAKWGPEQVRDFTKPVMNTWYETLLRTAGDYQALALIRTMSLLFSHAERIGWRPEGSNPCSRMKLRTPQPRRRAADWAEIDALVAAADAAGLPSIGTAVLMSVLQGQRQTDVIAARAADFAHLADGRIVWTFTRSKRGNDGQLYLHDHLLPRIKAILDRNPDDDRPLLTDDRSCAGYDTDLFGRRWREVRALAVKRSGIKAIATLQFRDLRRTFGVLSRAGGASRDDAAEVLGNSAATNPRLARTYMPDQLETASRAVTAIRRPAAPSKKGQK